MSIKDLFDKSGNSGKILSGKTLEALAEDIESVDYIKEHDEDLQRFVPPVDYSRPEKFARFGAAELYYNDSFEKILNTYPYDGSLKEKDNRSMTFEEYIRKAGTGEDVTAAGHGDIYMGSSGLKIGGNKGDTVKAVKTRFKSVFAVLKKVRIK